jgi:hypothetical protein
VPEHHSLDAAIAWVNATTESLDREDVPLSAAWGRVITDAIHAPGPIPRDNHAALARFAVQASASLGASPYNPIRLPLIGVAAGDALPAGTDAVIPLLLAETDDQAYIEIVEAVATGDNVEPQGATAAINATRTTPLVSPLRKTEPIGGLQSRPSPGNTGSAHPGTGRALLFYRAQDTTRSCCGAALSRGARRPRHSRRADRAWVQYLSRLDSSEAQTKTGSKGGSAPKVDPSRRAFPNSCHLVQKSRYGGFVLR